MVAGSLRRRHSKEVPHSVLHFVLRLFVTTIAVLATTATSSLAMSSIAGQRVLVTGAGRGIGRAIALICSQEGCKVALSSRTAADLEETASMGGDNKSNMKIFPCDVTNPSEVESMVQSVVQEWGGIDILINNAGGGQAVKGPAETLQADDLRSLLDLNVVAVHSVTSSVLRHGMLSSGGGRIVNIFSRAGKKGLPNISFYVVSKFALEGYTATLAAELADKNVLVNSLSPGMVDTQSFPKPPGKEGVRTPESVQDGLLTILESGLTGHYLHVDELDQVRAKGLADAVALKPINEATFSP
jgi:NAD(P)-dependent dehydrogenase (short-subunit alcohol dehydrogenase family)